MRILLSFLLANLLLLSTINAQKKSKYFEGEIHYSIENASDVPNYPAERLELDQGSSMILTFKNGDYKREYFDAQGKLVQARIVIAKEHQIYVDHSLAEKIVVSDFANTLFDTKIKPLADQKVLGYSCKVVHGHSIPREKGLFEEKVTYYLAKKLPVDPDWYSQFKDREFNEIMKIGKGIYLRLDWEQEGISQRFIATKVEPRKVEDSELELNKKKEILVQDF